MDKQKYLDDVKYAMQLAESFKKYCSTPEVSSQYDSFILYCKTRIKELESDLGESNEKL